MNPEILKDRKRGQSRRSDWKLVNPVLWNFKIAAQDESSHIPSR